MDPPLYSSSHFTRSRKETKNLNSIQLPFGFGREQRRHSFKLQAISEGRRDPSTNFIFLHYTHVCMYVCNCMYVWYVSISSSLLYAIIIIKDIISRDTILSVQASVHGRTFQHLHHHNIIIFLFYLF